MSLLQGEFITVQTAIDSVTNGVLATTGWKQLQVEPDGLTDFYPQIKKEARSPLSKNLMDEKGDVVDLDAAFKIKHDLNKDLADQFQESWFRSKAKYPGGTGTGRWVNGVWGFGAAGATLSACTATTITVSAGGALLANTLIYCRGFANALNNGLRVVGAASGNTSITVTGGATEASPPAGASVEVVGFQGASGDFTITAGGALASTVLDFTTLGLQQYAWCWIGGGTAAAPGTVAITINPNNRGPARMTSIAAHLITLDRTTLAFGTDAGTAKTVQIFFGPFLRNVSGDHADYQRTSHGFELVTPSIGAASATDYVYALGGGVDHVDFTATLGTRIQAEIGIVGFDIQDPTTSRQAGASASLLPLNIAALNTVSEMKRIRVTNTDGTSVLVDIQNWKLGIENNIKPYKKQGTLGAADLIYGKFQAMLNVDGAVFQDDVWKAVRDNRTVMFEAFPRNNDCGILFDLPACTIEGAAPKFAAQDAARFSPSFKTFRDPTSGFVCGMTQFPYLPAS